MGGAAFLAGAAARCARGGGGGGSGGPPLARPAPRDERGEPADVVARDRIDRPPADPVADAGEEVDAGAGMAGVVLRALEAEAHGDAGGMQGGAVLGPEHQVADRDGIEAGGPGDADRIGVPGGEEALGADGGEPRLEGPERDVVGAGEDGVVGKIGAGEDPGEARDQPVGLAGLPDLDDEAEADGAGMGERLGQRRHRLALEALVEPGAGIEGADRVEGRPGHEAGAVGGAVEEVVAHQDDLAVGGEQGVDHRRGAAMLARRRQADEGVLRRDHRMSAVAADMDAAVVAGEELEHGTGPPVRRRSSAATAGRPKRGVARPQCRRFMKLRCHPPAAPGAMLGGGIADTRRRRTYTAPSSR